MALSASRTAATFLLLARDQAGLSQRQLAERAGLAQSEIAKIESGKRQPSIPVLQRILAGAGLELRFRLASTDDHDQVLEARNDRRPAADRQAADERHARNVALFAANSSTE